MFDLVVTCSYTISFEYDVRLMYYNRILYFEILLVTRYDCGACLRMWNSSDWVHYAKTDNPPDRHMQNMWLLTMKILRRTRVRTHFFLKEATRMPALLRLTCFQRATSRCRDAHYALLCDVVHGHTSPPYFVYNDRVVVVTGHMSTDILDPKVNTWWYLARWWFYK